MFLRKLVCRALAFAAVSGVVTGCSSDNVGISLSDALQRPDAVPVHVRAIQCGAPKPAQPVPCEVTFREELDEPPVRVSIEPQEGLFPSSFKLLQSTGFFERSAQATIYVDTPFDGASLPKDEAALAMVTSLTLATNAAEAKAGQGFAQKLKKQANQRTYERQEW